METLCIVFAFGVTILTGRLLFRPLFGDADEFLECVKYSFTPDLFSLFRGEFLEDMAKSFKLSCYLFLSAGAGAATYFGLMSLI